MSEEKDFPPPLDFTLKKTTSLLGAWNLSFRSFLFSAVLSLFSRFGLFGFTNLWSLFLLATGASCAYVLFLMRTNVHSVSFFSMQKLILVGYEQVGLPKEQSPFLFY